jgi:hypothetical protein
VSDVDALKAALLGLIHTLQTSVDSGAAQVSDGWSQAAASFASLTQGSNNPSVGEIQAFMGARAQAAFEILGDASQAEEMIRAYVATL